MGEIVLPWWQLYFYYLISSTHASTGFSGFEKTVNGFLMISPNNLLLASVVIGSFNILDFLVFSHIVKQKFPFFSPFRFLNVLVKKYDMLLATSVMSAVISVQCVLIIDCRFDFSRVV